MVGGGAVLAEAHAQPVAVEHELVDDEPEAGVLLEHLGDRRRVGGVAAVEVKPIVCTT